VIKVPKITEETTRFMIFINPKKLKTMSIRHKQTIDNKNTNIFLMMNIPIPYRLVIE